MNESRLITATRASRMPIQEDFTTDPINLASECSKKLLNGFDSFLARKFFSASRPVNETARHSARVIHCADCRLVCFLPPKQLNHFKDESLPPTETAPDLRDIAYHPPSVCSECSCSAGFIAN